MSDFVQLRKDLPSGTIVIQRPEKRNALSRDLIRELHQAFDDFHAERNVRGVILTGSGPSFCSGTDLQQIGDELEDPSALQAWHEEMQDLRDLLETMLRFPKPIVAAVNGLVAGSGVALMLACDIVIAGQSAELSLPEVRRGLVAGVSAPLLVFRVGAAVAAQMLLSGETYSSDYLKGLGLFSDVVADDLVWARSHQVVTQLAEGAPSAMQLTKQLINETIGEALFTQLSIGSANTAAARSTESAKQGIEAFLGKKTIRWY